MPQKRTLNLNISGRAGVGVNVEAQATPTTDQKFNNHDSQDTS